MELFTNVSDCTIWNAALDAKFKNHGGAPFTRSQWDALLGDFSAVSSDPPAICFAEELVAAYPDAKIILVERDIEDWYRSFNTVLIEPAWCRLAGFLRTCEPVLLRPIMDCHFRWINGWFGARSREEMQGNARGMYRRHYELVRRITPRERLLEYRMGDGWEPLCRFLGKEVPQVEFPRMNDSDQMLEFLRLLGRRALRRIAVRVGKWVGFLVVLATVLWAWNLHRVSWLL